MQSQHTTLPIHQLGCAGAGRLTLERILEAIPGVTRVYVNSATEMAYVEFDAGSCDEQTIRRAITQAGYSDRQDFSRRDSPDPDGPAHESHGEPIA